MLKTAKEREVWREVITNFARQAPPDDVDSSIDIFVTMKFQSIFISVYKIRSLHSPNHSWMS